MTTTFGTLASAPTPTVATIGDYRVDTTTGLTYRNVDGRSWRSEGATPDHLIAALLAEPGTETNLSRGVAVIDATDTSPPVGTPAGTVVYKRT